MIVQKAQIVFAALAHHHLTRPLGWIGKQGDAFARDLALQGAGIGRDPDRRAIGLGPERGGGQIGKRLANPGSGLGQHHARLTLALARLKGKGRFCGIIGLGWPSLIQTRSCQELSQPRARRLWTDRLIARFARRGMIFPFGDARPDIHAAGARAIAHGTRPDRRNHQRRPGPTGAAQGLGQAQGILTAWPWPACQFGQ